MALLIVFAGGCESVDKLHRHTAPGQSDASAVGPADSGEAPTAEMRASTDRAAPVYARDFQRETSAPHQEPAPPATNPGVKPKAQGTNGKQIDVDIVPEATAREGIADVVLTPTRPAFVAGPGADGPPVTGPTVQVDAIVGAINGKPVRASEFLEPLAQRLARKRQEPGMTRNDWRLFAGKTIAERLNTEIQDELLATAGIADLTPGERSQLDVFMLDQRRRIVALTRGSEEAADRMLRDKGFGGLAEFMKKQRREFLIGRLRHNRILKRIQVSMRDIEVYYRQHPEKYNSPPQFVFRMIQTRTADTDSIDKIRGRLLAGEHFEDVAASPLNMFHADRGGKLASAIESDQPQETSTFFGVEALNEAARKVTVGGWLGPIEADGASYWIFLEQIVDRTKTLLEAQIEIEDAIRSDRFGLEFERYMKELQGRASFTSMEQMTLALLKIAEDQVWGPASERAMTPSAWHGPDADE